MLYPVRADGFTNREIILEVQGFGNPKILVDGNPAPQATKKNQFLVKRDDGADAIAELKITNLLDPVPTVILDGTPVKVTNSLAWYEYLAIGSPMILAGIGGAVGGAVGGTAAFMNGRIMRSQLDPAMRYAAAFGVAIAAFAVWFSIVLLIRTLMGQ